MELLGHHERVGVTAHLDHQRISEHVAVEVAGLHEVGPFGAEHAFG
ncbi:Uncharacterised protein [Mycobacteroides abscessus subsp. abscessus]|nr:Uncharacterised protein [Mycobacteroides abscessus subsp. abscessus]